MQQKIKSIKTCIIVTVNNLCNMSLTDIEAYLYNKIRYFYHKLRKSRNMGELFSKGLS